MIKFVTNFPMWTSSKNEITYRILWVKMWSPTYFKVWKFTLWIFIRPRSARWSFKGYQTELQFNHLQTLYLPNIEIQSEIYFIPFINSKDFKPHFNGTDKYDCLLKQKLMRFKYCGSLDRLFNEQKSRAI